MHLPYWRLNLLPSQFGAVKILITFLTVAGAWCLMEIGAFSREYSEEVQ